MGASSLKFAIVATIADAEDSIEHFVIYHLAIGFSRLFIFVDDNNEMVISCLAKYKEVEVFPRDESLQDKWKSTPVFSDEKKKNLIDQEVMVRQEMNFFVASLRAKQDGIDWLLHIDSDELFYPNNLNLTDYFSGLQKDGISSVTFLNYESISVVKESHTIFSSSVFFKVNFFKRGHWLFSKEQRSYIKNNSWIRGKYFNYYQNGKSIINLTGKKIIFYDVHSIMSHGKRLLGGHNDPIVLHFPCARYVDFYKKYIRLGDFSDAWMGYQRAGDFIERTHLEARDVFKLKNESDAKEFYIKNFILSHEKIQSLIDNKMAVKIDYHQKILHYI